MKYHYATRLEWLSKQQLHPFYEVSVQKARSTKLSKIGMFPAEVEFNYRGKTYSTIRMLKLLSDVDPTLYNTISFPKHSSDWFQIINQTKKLNKTELIKCTKQLINAQKARH